MQCFFHFTVLLAFADPAEASDLEIYPEEPGDLLAEVDVRDFKI
jgi:hypothetical protein